MALFDRIVILLFIGLCIASITKYISMKYITSKNDSNKKKGKQRRKAKLKNIVDSEDMTMASSPLDKFIDKYEWYLFGAIVVIAALIRFIQFPNIPAGFNQDEAAIAYDSYSIMNYGVDRNGYHFPVYPVSWGAGQGPFYMYFAIPFMWLFGDGIFGFRIGNVLLSLASVICVYFMMKKTMSKKAGIIGMLLFAIAPWNVFLARWSLDANPLPSLFIIAFCIFVHAAFSKKTATYLASASVFAIALYSYGAAYVVIPVFLALVIPYLIYHKKITIKQTLLSGLVFVAISLPLILFLLINYMKLDEIATNWISIPRLTVMRSDAIFKNFSNGSADVVQSFSDYFKIVIMHTPDWPWNSVKEYGIIYLFSLPLALLGFGVTCFKIKFKKFNFYYIYMSMFIAASILVLLINPNVNRIHVVFIPIICFIAIAILFIAEHVKGSFITITASYLIAFCMFFNYYVNDYSEIIGPYFYESFDEAIVYADDNSTGKVYVSQDIGAAYMTTLFHMKQDPVVFHDTVKYYDDKAEFRNAMSFGRYEFTIPSHDDKNAYYVIPNSRITEFDESVFNIERFKYYSVAYAK